MAHDPYQCSRTSAPLRYSFKNWSAEFQCPHCKRNAWFNLNFLGQRAVICDGDKFIKSKMTWGALRAAGVNLRTFRTTDMSGLDLILADR